MLFLNFFDTFQFFPAVFHQIFEPFTNLSQILLVSIPNAFSLFDIVHLFFVNIFLNEIKINSD